MPPSQGSVAPAPARYAAHPALRTPGWARVGGILGLMDRPPASSPPAVAGPRLDARAQWLSDHHDEQLVLDVLAMTPEARLESLRAASALTLARRLEP